MSKYSVKKPLTIFVGVVLILILGFVSFTSMTTDLLPAMELPYVAVVTTSVGDSSEKIEKSVTKPLEQQLATTSGIKEIQSVSSENVSMVIMQFYDNTDMNSVMIDISSKINLANLDDKIPNPTILQINPSMMPILVGAVDVDGMDIRDVSNLASEEIIPAIERVDGVASVTTTGLVQDHISISLNQEKIDDLNNQILAKVDSTLAATQAQLNDGEAKLAEAKKQVRMQEAQQSNKLINGEVQLNNVKGVLEIGLSGMNTSLDAMKSTISDLQKKREEALAAGIDTTLLDAAIKTAQGSYDAIAKQKDSLQTQYDTLQTQSEQLASGQIMLVDKISDAYAQIEAGEAQILQGKIAFAQASQSAYQSVGLSSALSKQSINQILSAENLSMPAGYIDVDQVATLIKVGDEFQDIDELKNLVLVDQQDMKVTLQDVADIQELNNIGETYAKINGNDGLLFTVQKQSTASTSTVSKQIQQQIDELQTTHEGLHITSLNDQGTYIEIVVDSVLNNLILGGILAAIILFFFLKDIKTTLITAFSIPISLMFAVVLMYFSGVTLNIISLAGLALGVGMLVDNSIVVVENTYRLKALGMDIKEAAIKGASQMAGAITASTLTTICVFLPIVFTEGITRQLFTDMGLTIAYSLIASLLIALTLVPAMSSKMLTHSEEKKHPFFDQVVGKYQKALAICLHRKLVLFTIVIVLLLGSVYFVTQMGTEFIPEMDSEMISVNIKGDKALTDEEFRTLVDEATPQIEAMDGVKTVGVMEGSGMMAMGGSSSSAHAMSAYIILDEKRKDTSQEIAAKINQLTTDEQIEMNASGSTMDMSALMGSGVQVVLKGQDLNELSRIADEVKALLLDVEGVSEVTNGQENNDQEIVLTVDKNAAMKYQLTVAQVYGEVASLLQNSVKSTQITATDGTAYPIVIEDQKQEVSLDTILAHEITANKQSVKISELVSVNTQDSMKSINHLQQSRTIRVNASLADDANIGKVGTKINEAIKDYEIPAGYSLEMAGENETINETLYQLVKMIALAIVFIYLIMVAQFQSLKSPFIVLFTLPLAFTGGAIALLLTGNNLSMIAMLGFLILAGVVVNNGIVFVDCVNQLKEEGKPQYEAILETGKMRIRPIIMTALTTILGLSTMAMGIGSGADMLAPMAIVTIGGLFYATFMTLFVVPCIYDVVNHQKRNK